MLARHGLLVGEVGTLPAAPFTAVTDDSRRVRAGGLFFAVRGTHHDGHDYLPAVERAGAAAAIVETEGRTALPHLVVRDGRRAAAVLAAAAYREPARELSIVAVTGKA